MSCRKCDLLGFPKTKKMFETRFFKTFKVERWVEVADFKDYSPTHVHHQRVRGSITSFRLTFSNNQQRRFCSSYSFLLSHTSTIRLSNTMKRKTPAVANTGAKRQKAAPLSDEANNAQYLSNQPYLTIYRKLVQPRDSHTKLPFSASPSNSASKSSSSSYQIYTTPQTVTT